MRKRIRFTGCLWSPQFEGVTLEDDEVHVWCANLDKVFSRNPELIRTLSPDELEKARRFHFARDGDRFVAARGILRILLGNYLQVKPDRIRFFYNAHGKPTLNEGIHFNLSHSHGTSLFAFTKDRDIGVDVEKIRTDVNIQDIASRFFSPREAAVIQALPIDKQIEAFFSCWTRKEAYIKAKGKGLSVPLDQFEVTVLPREPPRLLKTGWDAHEAQRPRWSIKELNPAEGFMAALAVEGINWRLSCWKWLA